MIGSVRSIPSKDGKQSTFCFIKGDDGKEYFMHASGLEDTWDNLKLVIATKREAIIEFEIEIGLKGPRATKAVIKNL